MPKLLILTRSYPSDDDLYKYPFVHQRVLAYRALGYDVQVFRPGISHTPTAHVFDGVHCLTGDAEAFEALARTWRPEAIAVHGLSEQLWGVLDRVAGALPIRAWLHGSEIPDFMRQKAVVAPLDERPAALAQLNLRCAFWDGFLGHMPDNFQFVFVSHASVELARRDWGDRLNERDYVVIPNPIDTDLFQYRPKRAADRHKILLIRPFDSHTYANDLAVDAIVRLLKRDRAGELQFTIIGDGPMFDATLQPLRRHPSVNIDRRFLPQVGIPEEHARHGIFLVPTRLDTQGLSRDEAMSSGLVPVTNSVPAILEFVDEQCCGIAPPDDPAALADEIWSMVMDPELFLRRSKNAAERIRAERSQSTIIPRELELLTTAAKAD